jgi:aminobenzoyl-glutamate utilization protein B
MMRLVSFGRAALGVLAALSLCSGAQAAKPSATKRAAVASVDQHAAEIIKLSDQVWEFAETALREHRSSKLLADYAESEGFRVQRGISGMPTAFVASFGEGRPIIGIMGEYDALPGLSQKATAEKAPLVGGAAGHACGHNMFGAGSLGAALAIKEQIEAGKLKGTIRYYGTPAEEAVGGKTYMARDGVFDGLDVMLAWHPDNKTRADTVSSQAMVDLIVEFKGQSAHAPTSRLHYSIVAGGDVPNVVPEHAKVWLWARDWQRSEVEDLLARIRKLADGAATMTETSSSVMVQAGSWEILTNLAGAHLLNDNLQWLGLPTYTEEEDRFARAIQRATNVEAMGMSKRIEPLEGQVAEGGSTDVGDVSWVAPTLHLTVATAPKGTASHAWPIVATGGMSIGHKGMLLAAKTLAATMVDLYERPAALREVRAEFEQKKGDVQFKAYLPDGPPPLPTE